jgi:integrase
MKKLANTKHNFLISQFNLVIIIPGLCSQGIMERRIMMPWRKYAPKRGKYGFIYHISKGIQVRKDYRGKWTLFIQKGGERTNHTFGEDREALTKAVKAAEAISSRLDNRLKAIQTPQVDANIPTFKGYSAEWVEQNSGRWDMYTYMRYESILRLHIWPYPPFTNGNIVEIARTDIKKRLRLLLKSHSPATVQLVHTVFCSILREAVDDKLISSNPAEGLLKSVLPPKNKRRVKEPDPLDMEERDRFLEHAEKICSFDELLILKVMLFAGFRLGEVLAMGLEHLDSEKMLYHVSHSYKLYRFGLPKKGKKRFVDLPDFLVQDLKRHVQNRRKESLRSGDGGEVDLLFVDPREKGLPYSQRKVQGLVKRVCSHAKLRRRHPHDLRHTYATILLMAHQSPAYVQNQLGHSSISITVDIYGHWIPGMGRDGLEDALLGDERKSHMATYKQKRSR